MKPLSKKIRLVFAVLLTAVLLAFLLTRISPRDVLDTLYGLKPGWVAAGFIAYGFSYLFRALRFRTLLKNEISLKELFKVVSIHNMWNNLLPLRTGEISYLFLLQKRGSTKTRALASLMVARIMDFWIIILVFFTAFAVAGSLSYLIKGLFAVFVLFAAAILAAEFGLLFYGKGFVRTVTGIFRFLKIEKRKFSAIILDRLGTLLETFSSMQKQKLPTVFLYSMLIWVSQYLAVTSVLFAMGVSLPPVKLIIGITFVLLIAALPVHGVGGFGTLEAAWGIVFSALGLSVAVAISSAFTYHIVLYLFFLVYGLSAWAVELKTTTFKTQ